MLREVWLKIRSVAEIPDGDIRAALDEMDLAAIGAAADVIGDIAREPDEDFQEELLDRYAAVRRFLPKLLKHLDFDAGIPRVVTAWKEPPTFVIDANGTEALTAAGVTVITLPELAEAARAANMHFTDPSS
ncbi:MULTISPECIES: hypothetical protein [unclassified Nonomuraea]|uniref:hypothetical protein n=1 Tax=unclassified Nonomuraea TaxID=2593643 RepID=UPI0034049673